MKKIIILNLFAISIAVLLFINLDNLLALSWNWGRILALLPITAGALSALIQNRDRAYKYFPKILIGSIFFSFLTIFLVKLFVYFGENLNAPILKYFNPFKDADEMVGHLGLALMYIFGGLIGVAAKGVNLVFLAKYKFRLNFNISFIRSFVFGSFIIFGANIYYVLNSIPPDGRWKLQIPVTGFFIILYLVGHLAISKKLIKNPRINYLSGAYNAILSLVFISCAASVQVSFQYVDWLYFRYIAIAPYLIIFGLGIVCYISLALCLQKGKNNIKKNVKAQNE